MHQILGPSISFQNSEQVFPTAQHVVFYKVGLHSWLVFFWIYKKPSGPFLKRLTCWPEYYSA